MSTFRTSYIDVTEFMVGLLRPSGEGDWLLHMTTIREMIPWCFAYEELNYASSLPYYYATMSRVPLDHLEVHAQLLQSGFSVQIGRTSQFGRIPVDQAIEETVNKETAGGTL